VEQVSRYKADFIELEKIGQGGFGHVWKARHKLDGNIYAIKKIKLSKNNSEENKRIKREVTHLSALNSPYIVRYFQTWVEIERDPNMIEEFASEEDYDEEEYDDESEDLGKDSFFYQDMKRSAAMAQKKTNMAGSEERKREQDPPNALMRALQASPVDEVTDDDSSIIRKRAKTDNIQNSDTQT